MRFVVVCCSMLFVVSLPVDAFAGKRSSPQKPAAAFCASAPIALGYLRDISPYENNGKCFNAANNPLRVTQVLGDNLALMSNYYGSVDVLMDFGDAVVDPTQPFRGVLIGLGAYQYLTRSGFTRTVHKVAPLESVAGK